MPARLLRDSRCLFFYPISRELNQKIANELTERRKGFAPQAGS
jgi:hypothetical protein